MGGKAKKKAAPSTKPSGGGGKKHDSVTSGQAVRSGPSRVLLLRHGESESNASGTDVPDPLLTDLGRVQASAWKGLIGEFGAESVLVSPLRRAIQTALLAFEGVEVPIEVCRHARELWWDEQTNTPSTPETLYSLLKGLPRGDQVCGVEIALGAESSDTPQSEYASIEALKAELSGRSEDVVAVVCHWGVINSLCGEGADNCALVDCRRNVNGKLIVQRSHDPPKAPRSR